MEINELISLFNNYLKDIDELWRALWRRDKRKKNTGIREHYEST